MCVKVREAVLATATLTKGPHRGCLCGPPSPVGIQAKEDSFQTPLEANAQLLHSGANTAVLNLSLLGLLKMVCASQISC
jgi:hypothetical protein